MISYLRKKLFIHKAYSFPLLITQSQSHFICKKFSSYEILS